MTLTLAELNKNPLNLEVTSPPTGWKGCDPTQRAPEQMGVKRGQLNRFVRFTDERWGWRAAAKNVLFHYRGGKNTIRKLIHAWCPPYDAVAGAQHTDGYVHAVAKGSGIMPDAVIDMTHYDVIAPIVWEMHKVEAGKSWGNHDALDLGLEDIGIVDSIGSKPPVPEPLAPPPPGKRLGEDGLERTPESEKKITDEMSTQKIVQGGTIAGGVLASAGSFFKIIPPWALGVAVVALVAVGALWALRSFGIIKRAA